MRARWVVLLGLVLVGGVAGAEEIEGTYETIAPTDAKAWGGPAGPAQLRLEVRAHRDGELTVTSASGGAPAKRPISWRYDAGKKRFAVKVGNERVAGVVEDLGGGQIAFGGAKWRRVDANAPAAPAEPAVEVTPPPAPVPQAKDEEAAPLQENKGKTPPPAPPPAPTPTTPTPPAPPPPKQAAQPPPQPVQPPPQPVQPPPPPGPVAPPPRPAQEVIAITAPPPRPAAKVSLPAGLAPLVGMWSSPAGDGMVVLELAADGTAKLGFLRGGQVVALRSGGRWGGDAKGALELRFGAETARGPGRVEGQTLSWMGTAWRKM